MTRYGRDLDWYLGDECHYEREEFPRTFVAETNSTFELWHYPSGDVVIREQKLDMGRVDEAWLQKEPPLDRYKQRPLAGIQLIISTMSSSGGNRNTFGFPKKELKEVMTYFNLPLSYLEGLALGCGCYSMYTASQLSGQASKSKTGFIISGPEADPGDLDIVFTWDAATRITRGILRVSNEDVQTLFTQQLRSLQLLASHPLTLAFFVLEYILLDGIDGCQGSFNSIVKIQRNTGHTGGLTLGTEESLIPIDLNSLSLEVSEPGQTISFLIYYAKSAQNLSVFLSDALGKLNNLQMISGSEAVHEVFKDQTQALEDLVKSASTKLKHLIENLEHYMQVINIQHQTVYNMIAQRDVQQNIELAKDSKSIAAASKRDSSAMKSIALLTMIVLPGTLIASIFAMPLFDWEATAWHQIPSSRFWFYWAITIPLTVAVLVAWVFWQRMYERRNEQLDAEARKMVNKGKAVDGGNNALGSIVGSRRSESRRSVHSNRMGQGQEGEGEGEGEEEGEGEGEGEGEWEDVSSTGSTTRSSRRRSVRTLPMNEKGNTPSISRFTGAIAAARRSGSINNKGGVSEIV